ncbi:MAG: DUF4197 domain-containing protein [Bacteroidetes bacterium]|nr:DUF4197 domain-containing protein [Bacteroidota bacterium]
MKKNIIPTIALIIMSITACTSQSLQQRAAAAKAAADKALQDSKGTGTKPLSNDEVIKGLKDALTVGTNNSTGIASKVDGYYKNPKLFIPFPPEAKQVKDKMDALGMKPQTDKFVMTLNRAAEEAAKNAAPIFITAVKGMSIGDGFGILKGADNAATQYLKDKTNAELKQKFTPIVKAAIDKVEVTKYWNPIITKYNKIPMVKKQNPDLTAYVTEKAMAGLFMLLAEEELKIRKDPMARVNDILKRVFGNL